MKAALLLACLPAVAGVLTVPQWISDNVILQTNFEYGARAFVNGVSDKSPVHVSANGVTYSVPTDADGRWIVMLNPGSQVDFSIVMTNNVDTITVHNASFGNVYFCSGQSNMVFPMSNTLNATEEIATLALFPQIHFFQTATVTSPTPEDRIPNGTCPSVTCNKWVTAAEAAQNKYIDGFSAMCFMTVREVARLHTGSIPIGIVQSAVGGTRVEAWMPKEAFDLCPEDKAAFPVRTGANAAMVLYNAMVNPFTHMSVRAMLWYQGEANADEALVGVGRTAFYECMYQAMIATWRDKKGMGDFAVITQQLPPSVVSGTNTTKQLATGRMEIRIAEAATLPHTDGLTDISGLSIGLDMGGTSAWGVDHPPNKNEMSRRMAMQTVHAAFAVQGRMQVSAVGTYLGAYDSYWTGPVFAGAAEDNGAVRITFTEGSAVMPSLKDVHGVNVNGTSADCTLCCAKQPPFEVLVKGKWMRVSVAHTSFDGSDVVLKHQEGVTSVRYAWMDFVECVVVNNDSLPLGPFVANLTTSSSDSVRAEEASAAIVSPPLGFNSWNFYHCNIDENIVKQVIDAMVSNGMKAAGYRYVNIDDCWQVARLPNGTLVPDPVRFPSGMKHLADYAHSKGMKFGVYTAAAEFTCQHRPGSYGYEVIDADTICDWGIDYLKIDECDGASHKNSSDSWTPFHQQFQKCFEDKGHYVVQSVEACDSPDGCGSWISGVANLWRTANDVQANWNGVLLNAHKNNIMADIATPGHFNDADMLEIGNVGLSFDEQVSHMSLWCIMSSPLLAGTDLVHVSAETLKILTNKGALAVNQDIGVNKRIQGKLVSTTSTTEVWAKNMSDGTTAVLLVNVAEEAADLTVTWDMIGLPPTSAMHVHDLWKDSDLPDATGKFTAANVAPHACVFVVLKA